MRILLISNYFFPNNHVGAVRPTRLYEYLKRQGHDVTVMTTSIADSPFGNDRYDYTYQENNIYRISTIFSSSQKQNTQTPKTSLSLIDIVKKINVADIDVHIVWISKVLYKIFKEKRLKKNDLVITTSPEHYNHLIGLILKTIFKIRWITDYRDGWTLNPSFNESNNALKQFFENFIEKIVLKNCDAIVTTSPGLLKKLIDIFKPRTQNLLNVMNGYDLDHLPPVNRKNKCGRLLNIIYTGSIDSNRSPLSFFKMMDKFCGEYLQYSDQIEIHLTDYIKGSSAFKKKIRKASENTAYKVKWLPFMPFKDLARYIHENSDVMLLCLGRPEVNQPNYNDWVLSKVFDCLLFKIPALAIIPPHGDTADIIKDTDCGFCIGNSDYKEFKKILLLLINHSSNVTELFSFRNTEKFSRDAQFKKLFEILAT